MNNSPRVVGQILKKNPFDHKSVPCHRVIKSDFFIGGYQGSQDEKLIFSKLRKLNEEGIFFDNKGYLLKNMRNKVFESFSIIFSKQEWK